MKNKKNKIKKVILLTLVLILICIGLIIYKSNGEDLIYYEDNSKETQEYVEERILPRNIRLLNQYKGNMKRDLLYSKLNTLANTLIDISNNSKLSVKEYFEKNKAKLENCFVDIDLKEFEKILNKVTFDEIKDFEYAKIEENNIVLDDYHIFKISLNYKNNNQIIFETFIRNEATGKENDILFKIVD